MISSVREILLTWPAHQFVSHHRVCCVSLLAPAPNPLIIINLRGWALKRDVNVVEGGTLVGGPEIGPGGWRILVIGVLGKDGADEAVQDGLLPSTNGPLMFLLFDDCLLLFNIKRFLYLRVMLGRILKIPTAAVHHGRHDLVLIFLFLSFCFNFIDVWCLLLSSSSHGQWNLCCLSLFCRFFLDGISRLLLKCVHAFGWIKDLKPLVDCLVALPHWHVWSKQHHNIQISFKKNCSCLENIYSN